MASTFTPVPFQMSSSSQVLQSTPGTRIEPTTLAFIGSKLSLQQVSNLQEISYQSSYISFTGIIHK